MRSLNIDRFHIEEAGIATYCREDNRQRATAGAGLDHRAAAGEMPPRVIA